MSIKFQYNGNPVDCDTPDEFIAIMGRGGKNPAPVTTKSNRVKPIRGNVGQDRYRDFIGDLSQNFRKVVMAIGSHAEISMDQVTKTVEAKGNMSLSAWITGAMRTAKRHDIQPEQLWKKTGERGSAKYTPTKELRAAVDSLRDTKISAVKQTA
jgi:hypothetical protein